MLLDCSEASDIDIKNQMRQREADSRCRYQAHEQKNTRIYQDKPGLPATTRELIKPILLDLSNDELLKKFQWIQK